MSTLLAPRLPPPLRGALDRDDAEGFTIALLTVSEDGFPHQALISVGECVALDDEHVRLALWSGSTAARNAARTRRSTLAAVVDEVAYTVLLVLAPRGEPDVAGLTSEPSSTRSVLDGRVVQARADTAPYAVIETGIRFRLNDPQAVLDRWADTRRRLRALGPPASIPELQETDR
jgi:hypothetical protein